MQIGLPVLKCTKDSTPRPYTVRQLESSRRSLTVGSRRDTWTVLGILQKIRLPKFAPINYVLTCSYPVTVRKDVLWTLSFSQILNSRVFTDVTLQISGQPHTLRNYTVTRAG